MPLPPRLLWFLLSQVLFLGSLSDPTPAGPVESWITSLDMSRTLSNGEPVVFGDPEDGETIDIRIDPEKTHQTLLGLGSSLEHTTCWNLWRLSPERRAEVLDRLVLPEKGIGMNLMRICIGAPDFTGEPWYSYDDMPSGETDEELDHFSIEKDLTYVIPVLKAALEKNPDLLFYASPWSPPGWMKTSDDLIGGHLFPKYYAVYAKYFLKFIQAYEGQGIPIHAVTVQNEPGVNTRDYPKSWWYPSCQWSLIVDEDTWFPPSLDIMGHPERDFIRDHLGPLFEEQGVKTGIWCYDHNLNNLWYPRAILTDPQAARYVDGTAFHPYSGDPSDMGAFQEEFPEKAVYLSEGSMFGVEGAVSIIEFLRNGASSYNAWVTMIDSEGKPNNGPFKASDTCIMLDAKSLAVTYGFEYYMYGQFMKFIRRGAVRIDSGESSKDFAHVAFRNPDGSLVLVVANPLSNTRKFRVGWNGLTLWAMVAPESVATYRWLESKK